MKKEHFKSFALGLILYTLLVILWGAWVRISHSGDGCGDTWPLCHGVLIPEAEQNKTWIEYFHRVTSGIYGIVAFIFYFAARKVFPAGNISRTLAGWVLFFTITEAALGAKLVLFGLVANNDTPFRAFSMSLHQMNSLLLMGTVILTWLHVGAVKSPLKLRSLVLPALFLILSTSGAWAALAATLFPAESLLQGLQDDLNRDSHFLIRLRILHPLIALTLGSIILYRLWQKWQTTAEDNPLHKISFQTLVLFLVGIAFGVSTLLALSPVWMKITHLSMTHLLWFALLRWVYCASSEELAKR